MVRNCGLVMFMSLRKFREEQTLTVCEIDSLMLRLREILANYRFKFNLLLRLEDFFSKPKKFKVLG